jgi:molybdopterin converting factor small subunit
LFFSALGHLADVVPVLFSASMSIPVLLFASYADAFGGRRIDVPVDSPCAVADLISAMRMLPGGHVLPKEPLVALNQAWVTSSHPISVGDEVAVIPPVAGG